MDCVEVRLLSEDDDTRGFSCGHDKLDEFFRRHAASNQFKLQISATHVACRGERIVGFVTLTAGTVEPGNLAAHLKKLPRYPVPVLLLARMGVASECQREGVGKRLLFRVFQVADEMTRSTGCVGVVVDAKAEAISFYEPLGFVQLGHTEADAGGSTRMFLPMKTIRAVSGAR